LRAALLDGLVGNANSCGVVTSHWCWRLGVPISSKAMRIGIASIQL
jgi:hypothetical protein